MEKAAARRLQPYFVRSFFLIGVNPRGGQDVFQQEPLGFGQRFQIQMRRPTGEETRTIRIDPDELQALR
jgi:hypothetical protein